MLITSCDGDSVGADVGLADGETDGPFEGDADGETDGLFEGDWLGVDVGCEMNKKREENVRKRYPRKSQEIEWTNNRSSLPQP